MQCVILAGGLGTRMAAWTSKMPKSLIPVAGRPFIEWQLEWLGVNGVEDVVMAVGYLDTLIIDHVADGSNWNVHVSYVSEGNHLLGTAGALRSAADGDALAPVFLVLYGDSYLPIEVAPVVEAFNGCGRPAMMTVWRNDGLYDRSNLDFRGSEVLCYDKRAANDRRLRYIDYGLSVLSRDLLMVEVPSGQRRDLGDLFGSLSESRRLSGFEVHKRFYEIGSEAGLRDLETYLRVELGG